MTQSRKDKGKRRRDRVRQANWTREQYLIDALGQAEELAVRADQHGSFQAAVRAKTQAAGFRAELDELRLLRERAELPETYDDHLDELLVETRRQRMAARGVAASNLMKTEAELLEQKRQRQEAEAARRLEHLAELELVDRLIQTIRNLPTQVQATVTSRLLQGDEQPTAEA